MIFEYSALGCNYKYRWAIYSKLLLLGAMVSFLLGACARVAYFEKDKYLLKKQVIRNNKQVSAQELLLLTKQTPNRRFLGTVPYATIYQLGKKSWDSLAVVAKIKELSAEHDSAIALIANNDNFSPKRDSAKIARLDRRFEKKLDKLNKRRTQGNWWMRVVGEKPIFFDSTQARYALSDMRKYLFQKGFFNAKVKLITDTIGAQITAQYHIYEGQRQVWNQIEYLAEDSSLQQQLNNLADDSLIARFDAFDLAKIEEERNRITAAFKNNGYMNFSKNFVLAITDTSLAAKEAYVNTKIIVKNPPKGTHQQYTYGSIKFYLDDGLSLRDSLPLRLNRSNTFFYANEKYRWGIIYAKLIAKPGALFRQEDLNTTQVLLNTMDMFSFVNITSDTTGNKSNKVNLSIRTAMLPRFTLNDEVGALVSAGAPGPFVTFNLRARNLRNKFSVFEVGGRFSEEGQFSVFLPDSVYRSREIGFNIGLNFPRLVFFGNPELLFVRYNPRTRLSLAVNYTRRPEYTRSLARLGITYLLRPKRFTYIDFSPIEATVGITPFINPLFNDVLSGFQSSLQQSFINSLVTSTVGNFIYNTVDNLNRGKGVFLRFTPDGGGLTSSTLGRITQNSAPDSVAGLKIFRYIRFSIDARKTTLLGKTTAIATRFNAGFANPLGISTTLPWEKFFFAGGGNSLRAWAPRRLGPGSFRTDNPALQYQFERPGEILLEASAELRQKVFKYFDLALFVDAGNIWLNGRNENLPGADFQWDRFHKEIAVGTGVGFRLDFSFLLIRVDVGLKVLDPRQPLGNRYVLDKVLRREAGEAPVLNFGVGYPF